MLIVRMINVPSLAIHNSMCCTSDGILNLNIRMNDWTSTFFGRIAQYISASRTNRVLRHHMIHVCNLCLPAQYERFAYGVSTPLILNGLDLWSSLLSWIACDGRVGAQRFGQVIDRSDGNRTRTRICTKIFSFTIIGCIDQPYTFIS